MMFTPENSNEKDIPNAEDAQEIIKYLQDHPNDSGAIPYLMEKYNCTQESIYKIVMTGSAE